MAAAAADAARCNADGGDVVMTHAIDLYWHCGDAAGDAVVANGGVGDDDPPTDDARNDRPIGRPV